MLIVLCCGLNGNTRWKYNFRNTARAKEIQQKWNTANEWTTHLHCFGAKLLTAKEILLIVNYYLVLLKKQRWNKSWTENARWSKVTPAHCVDCSESFINPQSFIFSCKTVHKNFTTLKNNKIYQPKEGRMSNTSLSTELGFSPSQTITVIPKDVKPTLSSTNRTIPLDFFSSIRL